MDLKAFYKMGSTAQHTTLTCVCLFYESAHSLGRETCPLYRSLCCRAWHLLSEHLLAELPPCCHLCLCSVVPPPPPRPPAFTVPCDTPQPRAPSLPLLSALFLSCNSDVLFPAQNTHVSLAPTGPKPQCQVKLSASTPLLQA